MRRSFQSVWKIAGASAVAAVLFLTGCGEPAVTMYEVPSCQGQIEEGQTQSDFDEELFYRNDKKAGCPDPFVLNNTERDGYYYLYGTEGAMFCYRSANLMDWEPVGNALDTMHFDEAGQATEECRTTWQDVWAPEVIYDEDTGLYYMFFSATPQEDNTVAAGGKVEAGTPRYVLYVAVSESPSKGFHLIDFTNPESCGEENVHTYDRNAYPHYYAKYMYLEPDVYSEFSVSTGGSGGSGLGGYAGAIDPHPYVDEDGQKYLYWVDNVGQNGICVAKMENWLKPDLSTMTKLTYTTYYTMEDYEKARAGETVELVPYENSGNVINEGPTMIKHNDKYYLTLSVNNYSDNSYQVCQAVADSPMGPFRKLRSEENGLLISGQAAGSQEISGTGHHCLITAGDQLLMLYHRHDDFVTGGSSRNPAIDEIKWVTIKDTDGNDLDVMYANGPTCTVQPKIEAFSDYRNIADEATVSGTEDAKYLTDGLLSIYKYGDPEFMEYVKETRFSENTTFTFAFDTARSVRAVMVYNSKLENEMFRNISRIEFVCEEDGAEVLRYIDNVAFGKEGYKVNDYDGSVFYCVPGASAYAEFEELKVKSLKITVEVPEGQETVGISEIRILGK